MMIDPSLPVRVRFAPSPTGDMHLGGLRTALYNYAFAQKHGGSFILRIEDTDVARSTREAAAGILASLTWAKLAWDEGPYFQSERLALYVEHLEQLKAQGLIYPAFETQAELIAMRQQAMQEKRNPIYDRSALQLSAQQIQAQMAAGKPFVWRFKVNTQQVTSVPEYLMAHGHYQVPNSVIGDFVITRPGTLEQPGMPLYNFVCAIDDALMGITHVIRGVEHLPNTPKQMLLYQAFGYPVPQFVHLPLIMKHGKKMSKRDPEAQQDFPVSVLARKDLGYLPEATLNHLALLGWTMPDGREIFSLEQCIHSFDLARLSKANANFDEKKYFFLNAHYIKQMPDDELMAQVTPFVYRTYPELQQIPTATLHKLIRIGKHRCKRLLDFAQEMAFFNQRPQAYDQQAVEKFCHSPQYDAVALLQATLTGLETANLTNIQHIDNLLNQLVHDLDIPFAQYGPIIRLALTGGTVSPGLAEMIDVLGQEETCLRLQMAIDFLQQANNPVQLDEPAS